MAKLFDVAKATLILTALGLAGFWCLTTTLDDMTRADCERGILAACKQLGK
ncbi:MAG: hypothetical protein ACO3GP_07535 [Candidatus Limnocylindrus sp.]